MTVARILIVAGSDSGGGAGIQADIRTVSALGGHAMTAVTAITAQNTMGVSAIHPVPVEMVIAQMQAVISDIGVDAVKIGMIGSAETAEAVAERLEKLENVPVVFDPVMVATSGSALADDATVRAFERLMHIATVTTPNLPELEVLGGEEAVLAHGCALLVKGGHGEGDMLTDRLLEIDGSRHGWSNRRIDTRHTHGTGCTLASAIATGLGQGMRLPDAIERARDYVRAALAAAPGLGQGHGPMGPANVRPDLGGDMRFNQVAVPVGDYERCKAFYRALGLRLIVDSPGNSYARFEATDGATLSLHGDSHAIYFECDALDEMVDFLRVGGVEFEEPPQDKSWGWREAWLRDPAGNRVCLFHGGRNRRYPPWRVP